MSQTYGCPIAGDLSPSFRLDSFGIVGWHADNPTAPTTERRGIITCTGRRKHHEPCRSAGNPGYGPLARRSINSETGVMIFFSVPLPTERGQNGRGLVFA